MPSESRTPFLGGAAIAAAALAVYGNSCSVPFVLDDTWNIGANPTIRSLRHLGRVLRPPSDLGVGGRPLYNLSFALNYAVGGWAVGGYHAVNLAIHILCGLVLYGIARRTLRLCANGGSGGRGARDDMLAFWIALLWTVHPLLTESVTYISERSELMMGMFYLLTLYFFIRAAEGPTKVERTVPRTLSLRNSDGVASVRGTVRSTFLERFASQTGVFACLSLAACALGMASKEVMVSAPLAVLLYDRTFVSGSFRGAMRERGGYYACLSSTWMMLGLFTLGAEDRHAGFGHGVSAAAYFGTELKVVTEYLRLGLWPRPLVFDYGLKVAPHPLAAWPYGLLLAALAAAAILALRLPRAGRPGRRTALGFAGLFVFLALAPTSSFVPVAAQPMAENRMYLPLIGIVVIAVAAIHALAGRLQTPIFAALAIALGIATVQRNAVYASGLSLWADTVAKRPDNARARSNYGAALHRAGQKPQALAQLEQAVAIDPGDPLSRLMYGNLLAEAGLRDQAVVQYRSALAIDPALTPARERLGALTGR